MKNKNTNVTLTLYYDGVQYKDDCVVCINGKTWVIRRGVPVSVPRVVALAIADAERQRRRVKALCEGRA